MSRPLPPKKDIAIALLKRSSVHVHLDPRVPHVVVPPWFKNQPQLVLQVGLNMPVPIPDLHLDKDGMSCTLSFNRSPFHCVVPWASVFAMVGEDGQGMVWPDDVPVEVSRQARPAHVGPRAVDDPPPGEHEEAGDERGGGDDRPLRVAPSPRGLAAVARPGEGADGRAARPRMVRGRRHPEDGSKDEAARKKKGAKRPRLVPPPEEPRTRLVAVPPPAPSEPKAPREGEADAGDAIVERPPAAVRPKVKRELPPYLRVVK